MTEASNVAFQQLVELDRRSRLHALGLPQQVEVKKTWDGIGFRLGKFKLLFATTDVRELLDYPKLTRVPGTKAWVRGIANVRGNLLPILDLSGYLMGGTPSVNPRSRVVVVQQEGIQAGLLVDQILGMQHFFDEEYAEQLPGFPPELQNVLSGFYQRDGENWGVLSLAKLIGAPEFMLVAA